MIVETHKKAKIVLCKDSFPWQNHSDNFKIQFKKLKDAYNDCRNSQKVKIHQYGGIVPWENHSNNLKTHFKDWNEASNDCGNSQKSQNCPVQRLFILTKSLW